MGRAINDIVDPLGIFPDEVKRVVIDPLGVFPDAGRDQLTRAAGESIAEVDTTGTSPSSLPPDAFASAFRRPRTPVTVDPALDRRRSIASAIRRRRASTSILGGTPPAADPLGAA